MQRNLNVGLFLVQIHHMTYSAWIIWTTVMQLLWCVYVVFRNLIVFVACQLLLFLMNPNAKELKCGVVPHANPSYDVWRLGFLCCMRTLQNLFFSIPTAGQKVWTGKTGRSSFFHELYVYSILSLSQKGSGNHISGVYRHWYLWQQSWSRLLGGQLAGIGPHRGAQISTGLGFHTRHILSSHRWHEIETMPNSFQETLTDLFLALMCVEVVIGQ